MSGSVSVDDVNVWFSKCYYDIEAVLGQGELYAEMHLSACINQSFQKECVTPQNFQFKLLVINKLLDRVERQNSMFPSPFLDDILHILRY